MDSKITDKGFTAQTCVQLCKLRVHLDEDWKEVGRNERLVS